MQYFNYQSDNEKTPGNKFSVIQFLGHIVHRDGMPRPQKPRLMPEEEITSDPVGMVDSSSPPFQEEPRREEENDSYYTPTEEGVNEFLSLYEESSHLDLGDGRLIPRDSESGSITPLDAKESDLLEWKNYDDGCETKY